jgi:hypothetical protein
MSGRTHHDTRPLSERLHPVVSGFVFLQAYHLALGLPHDLFDELMAMDDQQAEYELLLGYLATGEYRTPIMDREETP